MPSGTLSCLGPFRGFTTKVVKKPEALKAKEPPPVAKPIPKFVAHMAMFKEKDTTVGPHRFGHEQSYACSRLVANFFRDRRLVTEWAV